MAPHSTVTKVLLSLCSLSPSVTSSQRPCWRNELAVLSLLMVCWIHKNVPKCNFLCYYQSSPQSLHDRLERARRSGNQIWSLLGEKVNQRGKPPSHCLSSCRDWCASPKVEWRISALSMFLETKYPLLYSFFHHAKALFPAEELCASPPGLLHQAEPASAWLYAHLGQFFLFLEGGTRVQGLYQEPKKSEWASGKAARLAAILSHSQANTPYI